MILIHKETAEIIEYRPESLELDFVNGISELNLRFYVKEIEIPFDDLEDLTNFISKLEILGWL